MLVEQAHGVAYMGAHRGPQGDGLHGLGVGSAGVADAHGDAQLSELRDHVQHSGELRGQGDVTDAAPGQILIMPDQVNVGILQQMLRHGPLVFLCQEGALQVDAHQLRALPGRFPIPVELPDAPFGLLLGVRQYGGLEGSGAVPGKEGADGFQILGSGSVYVHANGSVHMGVDKARDDPGPLGIDDFRPGRDGSGKLNFAVYDVQGQVLELAVHIDGAILNIVVHIVLLKFKKRAASCEAALRIF